MSLNNENNTYMQSILIGDVVANTPVTLPGVSARKKLRLKSARLINNAALAGDDTNHVKVALKKVGGNEMASLLTTLTPVDNSLVQRVGKDLVLASAVGDQELLKTENAEVEITHPGTGAALTDAVLQLEWYKV